MSPSKAGVLDGALLELAGVELLATELVAELLELEATLLELAGAELVGVELLATELLALDELSSDSPPPQATRTELKRASGIILCIALLRSVDSQIEDFYFHLDTMWPGL